MSQNQDPTYGQNQVPVQPYGQQPQQSMTPVYGQPAQQTPAQPYVYPNQQTPSQPYGQPASGYSAPAAAYQPSPIQEKKRSSVLGIIALALVVICGIGLSVGMFQFGALIGQMIKDGSINSSDQPAIQNAIIQKIGSGTMMLLNVIGIFGFVGWIMGIVATVTKRGRAFGIVAIILGVIAPLAAFGAIALGMAPYLPKQ